MKKHKTLTLLSFALMATALMGAKAAEPKFEGTSGKEVSCRVKVRFKNEFAQTVQLDNMRVSSMRDDGFFTKFALGGADFRPVTGAMVSTPMLDVQVPDGHQLRVEAVYRTQKTAGKNPTFSPPKTQDWRSSVKQQPCSLDGQTLTLTLK